MQAGLTVSSYFSKGVLWGFAECSCAPHTVVTAFLRNIWPCTMGHRDLSALYSFEIFASLLSADLFSWSCAGFQAFSPPRVYLSVWTCSPGGIVEVGVLSGLIAVWCLVGRRAWLGRRWGKTSCPHSLLSLSHLFSVSPALFPPFSVFLSLLSLSLWLSTWLHRMMAVLHGSLTGRERWTDTKGWEKERGVERAAHRFLKHRLPRCSPGVCWLHQRL